MASVLDMDNIPEPVSPAHPDEDFWREEWRKFFLQQGYEWTCTTYDEHNWGPWPKGYSIAHVLLRPGVLHAIVMKDGVPVHDPMPGSPFLGLPSEQQKRYSIEGYSVLIPRKI